MNIDDLIEQVRAGHALDRRSSVFEIHYTASADQVLLTGHTTENDAAVALVEQVAAQDGGRLVLDEIVRLPGHMVNSERNALVRSAVAPVYLEPRIPSAQITQVVLGSRLDLLSEQGAWWRVRSEDGYIGWMHGGYLAIGAPEWTREWERGATGESVVSLGAELVDDDGRPLAQLPWGARLIRFKHDHYELPDGRTGLLGSGEVVPMDRLFDRFPPRGDSVIRTARRWLGVSYLWGGGTLGGVDCSGLAQAVLWMHGIGLPRDSDLQARVGLAVETGADWQNLKAGDLLFFSETPVRVSHVAISLGDSRIIHASLGNGCVETNDVLGDLPFEKRLHSMFMHARRLLPD